MKKVSGTDSTKEQIQITWESEQWALPPQPFVCACVYAHEHSTSLRHMQMHALFTKVIK